jgi:hypothetical protein
MKESHKRRDERRSQCFSCSHDRIGSDAELPQDHITGRRHAWANALQAAETDRQKRTEAVDADGGAVETNVLGP